MNYNQIVEQIKLKQSFLCVGLDTEINKLPAHLPQTLEGALTFNKKIIDATQHVAVSYKINTAFYEQYGHQGWKLMEETLKHIPDNCFTIADAKRGDIGNTSTMYAKAFFDYMNFDSVTVAPYMGKDSIEPFLQFKDKFVICLALTSNKGSENFQMLETVDGKKLYKHVLEDVMSWGSFENTMFVTGATKSEYLNEIRQIAPKHFFLVPGVGAQGGTVEDVCKNALNNNYGVLINSSRGIIYASNGLDFDIQAKIEAEKLQNQMKNFI